jgi:hypothetical protein
MLSCIDLHASRIAENASEAAVDAFFGHEVLLSEKRSTVGFYECSGQSIGLDFRNGSPHPDADGREESASALQRSAVAVLDLLDERQQVENGRCLQHDAESKYHAQEHPLLSSRHGLRGRAMTPLMVPCSLQSCLIERHGHFRQQCRRLSKNSRIPPICPSVWE